MVVKLKCRNCGAPDAALEPQWGSHHGRFRVSIYECVGHKEHDGCGALGIEVYDDETEKVMLYGKVTKEAAVPLTDEPKS